MGSRTAPFGGFPCDFNIVDRFMRRAYAGVRSIE